MDNMTNLGLEQLGLHNRNQIVQELLNDDAGDASLCDDVAILWRAGSSRLSHKTNFTGLSLSLSVPSINWNQTNQGPVGITKTIGLIKASNAIHIMVFPRSVLSSDQGSWDRLINTAKRRDWEALDGANDQQYLLTIWHPIG